MRHLAVCALLFAGCYSPTFHDGALRCGNDTPHCPDGYHCAQDNTCWADGHDPTIMTGTDENGTACTVGSTCLSGFCADGVCCDKACNGQCEACDVTGASGTCTPVTGPPHGSRTACAGSGSSCDGTCDGTNTSDCSYPSSSTICGAACDGHCNGSGSCSAASGGMCPNGFACGVGACKTSCTVPADCQTNFSCTAGACVRIAESDCLDGLDNNGDGLIDCADPTCTQVECVPTTVTPVGTVQTACDVGVTGTHINQGFNAPSTCHGCGCTTSGSCAFSIYGDQSGAGCFGGSKTLFGTFSSGTTCATLSGGNQYYSVQAVPSPSATCSNQQTGVPDSASYATTKNFCPSAKSPAAAACPAAQVCVPKPATGSVCTLVAGSTCPSVYPTNSGTWYGDGTSSDNRSCTCSGCAVTSNGSCDVNQLQYIVHDVSETTVGQCVDSLASCNATQGACFYCSGSCCSWTTQSGGGAMDQYWHHFSNVDSVRLHNLPANSGSACSAGTGTVTSGSATPGTTYTVCCP
jgi:hypothetical protein